MACATDDGRRVRNELAQDASAASCEAANTPRVFLDDGQGRLFALPPLPRHADVEVSQARFERAMAKLAAGVSTPLRPLMPRLTLAWAPPLSSGELAALVRDYRDWCTRRPGDCLPLAEEGLSLEPDEKVDMALSFAVDGVWAGAHSAVQDFVDPAQLYTAVITSLPMYLTLLVLPEPITNLGRNRAGQAITDGQRTIHFDENGFPAFKTKFETLLDAIHIGSRSRPGHYRAANQKLLQAIEADPALARELGLSRSSIEGLRTSARAPDGYAWHHHQDVGRMQLVPDGDHLLANSHTGGMAIWGGGR